MCQLPRGVAGVRHAPNIEAAPGVHCLRFTALRCGVGRYGGMRSFCFKKPSPPEFLAFFAAVLEFASHGGVAFLPRECRERGGQVLVRGS